MWPDGRSAWAAIFSFHYFGPVGMLHGKKVNGPAGIRECLSLCEWHEKSGKKDGPSQWICLLQRQRLLSLMNMLRIFMIL